MLMGKSIFLLLILLFKVSLLCSQVPVFTEPKVFNFQNHTTQHLKAESSAYQQPPNIISPQTNTVVQPGNAQVHNPSMWMINKYYVKPNMTPQEQVRYADEQIRVHELEKRENELRIREANAELEEVHIDYELPLNDLPEKDNYAFAFEEITQMLNGHRPLNLERAVFLAEHAFDQTLNFKDFDDQLNKAASIIGLKMEQDKISPLDNLGKVMTTFKFMADTITVNTKQESKITTYPKTYDFEDFWGRHDYKKMFVSKLLKEGRGQCHSLPLLFLILCEKIGAEASLSFAPNHSYVKFKDKRGKWHNFELTNGMLASDHFIIESGFIKAEAMQSKIYMEPLTKKQAIVQCLNDLALGYQRKYGYDPFVKFCSITALSHDPKSLTAQQTLSNYYVSLSNYLIYQYRAKGLNKNQFDQDVRAKLIIGETSKALKRIDDLGYADMPAEAYEIWLNSIQKEVARQQHKNEVKVLGGMIEIKK